MSIEKAKATLRSYGELFGMERTEKDTKNEIRIVAIDKLVPFSKHPFRLYDGERLDDMVESIKANGVIVPIIAREIGGVIEILAGHNRVNAARLAGLHDVPALVLNNISDEEATVYAIETNLMQRSLSDMPHSEKAEVISGHYSKMFSQGKRNDILKQIAWLEARNPTSSQVETKLRSDEKLGEIYNLSRATVARYIRIQQLIQPLKARLDKGGIPFVAAVALSFLKESEQFLLENCINEYKLAVGIKKANMLRRCSEDEGLNFDRIYEILSSGKSKAAGSPPEVKIKDVVCAKYFRAGQSVKEIQDIIEKALDMYFANNGDKADT